MSAPLTSVLGMVRRPSGHLQIGMRALSLHRTGAQTVYRALENSGLEGACAGACALLAQNPRIRVRAQLACGWTRLLLLPWIDQLSREEHWRNYAAARFEEHFGEDAAGWQIRVARDLPGHARIAVAWPRRLCEELAAHRQLRSVRVGLLEHLGALLEYAPEFTGCIIELDGNGAGFLLLTGGKAQRVRWCRYDGAEGLASAVHAEWASVLAAQALPADTPAALAVTPPALVAGSDRAAAVHELGARLGIREG